MNKSSGVELSPGPEGSATRRFSISESPLDDSHAERIRPILMLPAEIVEEEKEVDAPVVSEVCATKNESGDGIPEVSPEFHALVELCARNLRESWGHIQNAKKALWAFFVPIEPAKPCIDPTAYRSGSLEVACIHCHAAKNGVLHPEFPVCKDEEQRRNDEDIDCWAGSLAKDKQGRVPKSVFFYKPHDGNGTVKYHVNTYHSKELHEVRFCVRFPFLNDCFLTAMYRASQVSRLLEIAAPGRRTQSIEGSSQQEKNFLPEVDGDYSFLPDEEEEVV